MDNNIKSLCRTGEISGQYGVILAEIAKNKKIATMSETYRFLSSSKI